MPESGLLNLLRDRSDEETALVVRYFERLNTLAEIRFERPLRPEEQQELLLLRVELRNRLAQRLEKR